MQRIIQSLEQAICQRITFRASSIERERPEVIRPKEGMCPQLLIELKISVCNQLIVAFRDSLPCPSG